MLNWFKRKHTCRCVLCGKEFSSIKYFYKHDPEHAPCGSGIKEINMTETVCEVYHCEVEKRDFHIGTYRTYEFRKRCVVCKENVDNSKHECKGAKILGTITSVEVSADGNQIKYEGYRPTNKLDTSNPPVAKYLNDKLQEENEKLKQELFNAKAKIGYLESNKEFMEQFIIEGIEKLNKSISDLKKKGKK